MNERYQKYKETYQRYMKKYYAENREWFARYGSEHREQQRVIQKKYREKVQFGGIREQIILRDGEKCLTCGMTREEHKRLFGEDITVNHIDGRGRYSVEKKQ
jgi:hypothetical protein